MSNQISIRVPFQSDFTSQDALLNFYRNEDYVAHYDEIHPARPLMARWPFALIGRLWQAMGERRQLRLACVGLGSLSSHLLADIGAGSFASMAAGQERTAVQLRMIQSQQAEARDAMAALARAPKQQAQLAPKAALTDAADQTAVVRAPRSRPKIRNMGLGRATGHAVPTA